MPKNLTTTICVGDIIQTPRPANRRKAVYRVTGVWLGGEGQESVVGLEVLDIMAATANGETVGEMLVPLVVLCAAQEGE